MKAITIKPIHTDSVDVALKDANEAMGNIKVMVINNQESYEGVAEIRKLSNAKIKDLEELRKSITKPLDEVKSKIMNLFRGPTDICKQVIGMCDKKMITWTDKQEEIRKREQERLERQAEATRKKKEEEETVLREKEEAKRREAEKLAAEGRADEARKAQAEADKAAARADKKQEKAAEIIAPVAAPRVEKPAGVHYVERWYGDVEDKSILSDDYKIVDYAKINKVMQATKGTLSIPGVKARMEKTVSSRR